MRLVALMVALLIVCYLVYKQIEVDPDPQMQEAQAISSSDVPKNVPRAPTNPKEVQQFREQMSEFMKEDAAKREAIIEGVSTK